MTHTWRSAARGTGVVAWRAAWLGAALALALGAASCGSTDEPGSGGLGNASSSSGGGGVPDASAGTGSGGGQGSSSSSSSSSSGSGGASSSGGPATDAGGSGSSGGGDGGRGGGDSGVHDASVDATAPRDASVATDARPEVGTTSGGGIDASVGGSGPLLTGVQGFPAPNAQGLCADPPLRLTFTGAPTLGTSGKIQVFDLSAPATAVAVVDMGATAFTSTIGGMAFNTPRPAYVDGNAAVVYLPSHPLAYGKTYYVTVDAGAIVGPTGTRISITGNTTWRFSTAPAAPKIGSTVAVALDGTAPFCSLQGALDAIPTTNTAALTVSLATGTYHEIIHSASKNNVTITGADRAGTVISAMNNNTLNPSTVGRSLVGIDRSTGLIIENLTIQNTTPQGGSQAEALRLESCDMCVLRNATVLSLQDTLLWDGRIYADNCLIGGNVDFVWGGGTAYFNNCEIKDLVEAGWNVQARNPATTYGYVFVDSKLTSDTGITGHGLARIDVSVYPASNVAYINCTMGSHISPAGWTITGGTATSQLRFWEYQSVDPTGKAIDVSKRAAGSAQLTAAQAAMLRTPSVVLAGWTPPTN